MVEMGISRAKASYDKSHFSNQPCEVGNVCWLRERGTSYFVKVREDTKKEREYQKDLEKKFKLIDAGKAHPADFGWDY